MDVVMSVKAWVSSCFFIILFGMGHGAPMRVWIDQVIFRTLSMLHLFSLAFSLFFLFLLQRNAEPPLASIPPDTKQNMQPCPKCTFCDSKYL